MGKRMKVLFGQRRTQVLVTMAVLLLAVAVVIGSGASFTSTSANPSNVFSAGNLTHFNSKDGAAILTAAKMMPGDDQSGTVTIRNTGDGEAVFYLSMKTPVDTINAPGTDPLSETLLLNIVDDATPAKVIYDGKLADFTTAVSCGLFASLGEHTYTFTVTFPDSDFGATTKGSDNKYKNCSTEVEFDWEAISN